MLVATTWHGMYPTATSGYQEIKGIKLALHLGRWPVGWCPHCNRTATAIFACQWFQWHSTWTNGQRFGVAASATVFNDRSWSYCSNNCKIHGGLSVLTWNTWRPMWTVWIISKAFSAVIPSKWRRQTTKQIPSWTPCDYHSTYVEGQLWSFIPLLNLAAGFAARLTNSLHKRTLMQCLI